MSTVKAAIGPQSALEAIKAAPDAPETNKTPPPSAEKAKPLPVIVSYALVPKKGLHQIIEIRTQGKTVLSTIEVEEENLKIIGLDKIGVFIEMDLAGLKR